MRLKYEPASEPLHISVKQLFLNHPSPSTLWHLHVCDARERDFFIDNLLVRNHFIIVMIRWTGLAPWAFEFPLPGSLTSTLLRSIYFWITQLKRKGVYDSY